MRHLRNGFIAISFLLGTPLFAHGIVIQITRALRMSESEKLPPKDIYFDLGTRDGLRDGDFVDIFRPLTVVNGLTGEPEQLVRIRLGRAKVFVLGTRVSIGRMAEKVASLDLPAMESTEVMLGDEAELAIRAKTELQSH